MCVLRWLFFAVMVAILSAADGGEREPQDAASTKRPADVARAR
jgi:hypothetical protein